MKTDTNHQALVVGKQEVTLNIALPSKLHRKVILTCAALNTTLKDAVIQGLMVYVKANAKNVKRILGEELGDE